MATPVVAQDFPYNFQTWNITNGLSSNFYNAICSDRNGYIYVGTNNGVYSFNGRGFNPLPYPGREPLMGEGNVENLLIDQYNRLWFASQEYGLGLIHLDKLSKPVEYFVPPVSEKGVTTKINVAELCFDAKGVLWVGTRGNGLYRFDTSSKRFQPLHVDNTGSSYNSYIRSLTLHNEDTMFVGIVNGLSLLNPNTSRFTHLKMLNNGKTIRPTVRSVNTIGKDSFVLVTDRGCFGMRLSTGNLSQLFDNNKTGINFKKVNGNDFIRVSAQEFWIATDNDGVLFYKTGSDKKMFSYQLSMFNKGISKGFVGDFFRDANNNIWIAHQNGLSLLQSPELRFSSHTFNDSSVYAGTLFSTPDKFVFIRNRNITLLDPVTNQTETHSISTRKNHNAVASHALFYDNQYYIFSNDSFFVVDKKNYQSKLLPLHKQNLDSNIFKHFRVLQCIADTLDDQPFLLMLTLSPSGTMLLTYDIQSGNLEHFKANGFINPIDRNEYTAVIKSEQGKYWISTRNKGILYINMNDPGKNEWHSVNSPPGKRIVSNNVSDILLDNNQQLWMLLFNKGLACINLKNSSDPECKLYAKENGLTDDRLYRFIQDDNDNFWITANSGIFCFEKKKAQFLHYGSINGITNIKYHINEIIIAKNEKGYVLATDRVNEIIWFKPANMPQRKAILLLTNFNAGNQKADLSNQQTHMFAAEQNSLDINYDILDYEKTGVYQIIYKLEGNDNTWQATEFTGVLKYRQLPGGNYLFRIKLKYADGSLSEEQIIRFTIKTLWYKTAYFKLLLLLGTIALSYMLAREYVQRKLAKQKAELELQQAILLERTRISSELHDDLGGGLSTIRILSETNNHLNGFRQPGENMHKISAHSKDLLQKMTEIVWALNIKNDTLDQLLSYIRHQAVQTLDETGIQFKIEMPENIPPLMINGVNRRHLLLLVKEVIHNVIKHSNANFVYIRFSITEQLEIVIHDNGRGIDDIPAAMQKGNGLHTMQQHAKALQGLLRLERNGGTSILFTVALDKISYESVIPHAKHDD